MNRIGMGNIGLTTCCTLAEPLDRWEISSGRQVIGHAKEVSDDEGVVED
jgi:hypothetical protein